jgi:hypothetical protein
MRCRELAVDLGLLHADRALSEACWLYTFHISVCDFCIPVCPCCPTPQSRLMMPSSAPWTTCMPGCVLTVHLSLCVCSLSVCLLLHTPEPSDDAIKRTLDYLHDRAKGATYFTASDPGVSLSVRGGGRKPGSGTKKGLGRVSQERCWATYFISRDPGAQGFGGPTGRVVKEAGRSCSRNGAQRAAAAAARERCAWSYVNML